MPREEHNREILLNALNSAIHAVQPENCLARFLPKPPDSGKIILLAGGKAAGAMMEIAAAHYLERMDETRVTGVAVTKQGPRFELCHLAQIEAGHPIPDAGSQKGARRVMELANQAGPNDLVLVLLSGGASALWNAPLEGISLDEKRELTLQLLRCGADIAQINCVRKHISNIKGGRLAKAVAPARLVTLAISDVVGDAPSDIASGPTAGDPTTLEDARQILKTYDLDVHASISTALQEKANETPFPDDPVFANADFQCIASGALALAAAERELVKQGIGVINLGDLVEGEARQQAVRDARQILERGASTSPVAYISGGELTVTIRGKGKGGPNQEYALALAIALDEAKGISAIVADTDGCDGGRGHDSDPAGAMIFPSTLMRATEKQLNAATFLADNDSGSFFEKLGDLVQTGPTFTNVNDFRLILINKN